ncbi:serine/threonine-protein kinase [Limnoglobus roseus]|uniref:non-specific serine/threonine protein kinase n=1 Tax=Limnoglobus roseus TaxID=2598579 RepID=A0A5C1ABR4_9BACT|nr:serine/threonine-protein kinase [Limnoglobus roseus]QEL16150.1 serine/threonine protein kinase [Limnoglobus roseus]
MPDPTPDPPPDLTGKTLGDFYVQRKLGQGGMGQVYLARQLSLKREVALKLLNTHLAQNETALKRFQAEAEAIAQISHPNIVQVFAIGENDGLRYMALEYVRGLNLRDYLERKGPPELTIALSILRQVAAALQRASELGIVHRDIKPENILLTRKVEVKVADFGLSRLTQGEQLPLNLTQSGVTVGTPLYMSPEQVRGQATDHRSDIYSLGVTAYHLLAGEPPFTGANAIDVAMKHVNEEPPPLNAVRPDLPADLCALVHKMMAKRPTDRYQSAKEILRDVAKLREGHALGFTQMLAVGPATLPSLGLSLPLPSTTTAQLPLVPPPSRWPVRILAALAVAGVFTGGWFLFGRLHPPAAAMAGPTEPGLPAARLPEAVKLISARESDLLARLDKRAATAAEVIDASIDLGLLYVKEHRYPEAEKVFHQLEHEKPDRARPVNPQFPVQATVSRLGIGIVQAHQDKAKDSIATFRSAIDPLRKPLALGLLQQFLMEHRDLVLAVAEAVQRDADNLPKGEKFPLALEKLRSPATMLKE